MFNFNIILGALGVLVQFISATLFIIYKSIVKQSISYFTSLERINLIHTSIRLVNDISVKHEQSEDFKNQVRAELAKKIIDVKINHYRNDQAPKTSLFKTKEDQSPLEDNAEEVKP